MPTDADRISSLIETLGESLGGRMGDLGDRLACLEIDLKKVLEQQAEDRGRDVNIRLHDHEMRTRKLEQFKFWLLGAAAAAGAISSVIMELLKTHK